MKVVRGKFGGDRQSQQKPNDEIIKMLEDVLEDAKAGRISQLAFCGIGSTVHDGFWVHPDTRGWLTTGQMQSLMAEITSFIDSSLSEKLDQ